MQESKKSKPKKPTIISNLYLTPKSQPNEQDDPILQRYLDEAMRNNAIVTTDINAHSSSWYSEDETDHRGRLIEDTIDQ